MYTLLLVIIDYGEAEKNRKPTFKENARRIHISKTSTGNIPRKHLWETYQEHIVRKHNQENLNRKLIKETLHW